jgi:hypothetical protein
VAGTAWLLGREYDFIAQAPGGVFVCWEAGVGDLGWSAYRVEKLFLCRRDAVYYNGLGWEPALLRDTHALMIGNLYRQIPPMSHYGGERWGIWWRRGENCCVTAPAWFWPLPPLALGVLAWRMSNRRRGHCSACGYSLAGLRAAPGGALVCPECGAATAKGTV